MRNYIKFFLIIFLIASGPAFANEDPANKKVYKAFPEPDGLQRVNIVSGKYFLDPNHIIVKVNLPVELHIKKEPDIKPHDIVINAPDARPK